MRTKYQFTEKWRKIRKLMYPFTNEKTLTKTAYGNYKTVSRSKVEEALKELLDLGFIAVCDKMNECNHPENKDRCSYNNCPFKHRYAHPHDGRNLEYHEIYNWSTHCKAVCSWNPQVQGVE